jgi:SagB-type dehydrogenase family enzyme
MKSSLQDNDEHCGDNVMLDMPRTLMLPKPRHQRVGSVGNCIRHRRSIRSFRDEALTLEELGQLLWAAQGQTDIDGRRSTPSAGALYPLETSVLVGKVLGVDAGMYRYSVPRHALTEVSLGDRRQRLIGASGGQEWIATASAVVCIAAVFARTTIKYGERSYRYVFMEAGLAAANLMLQAVALGLASTIVGAFDDDAAARVAHLAAEEIPLCLVPVGRAC